MGWRQNKYVSRSRYFDTGIYFHMTHCHVLYTVVNEVNSTLFYIHIPMQRWEFYIEKKSAAESLKYVSGVSQVRN